MRGPFVLASDYDRIVVELRTERDKTERSLDEWRSESDHLRAALERIADDGVENSRDPRTVLARLTLAANPKASAGEQALSAIGARVNYLDEIAEIASQISVIWDARSEFQGLSTLLDGLRDKLRPWRELRCARAAVEAKGSNTTT